MQIMDNFLTVEECQEQIERCETLGFEEIHSLGNKMFAKRQHGRVSCSDPELASFLFERLRPLIPAVIDNLPANTCSSNIRFYRYSQGQCFGCHIDESNMDACGGMTKLTVLVYLSGGTKKASKLIATRPLVGGETVFYNDVTPKRKGGRNETTKIIASITPECGRLLLHTHGDQCLTHEASPVIEGIKYVLRTDVIYGPT